jgi:hypothetical protein
VISVAVLEVRGRWFLQVKELLSANFVEGLLNDKEQLLSSTAHPLPETRKLGQPLTEDKDAAISVHHVQMCQADDDIKVGFP